MPEPEDVIAEQRQEIASLKAKVRKLQTNLDERDERYEAFQEEIRTLKSEKAELEAKLPGEGTVILSPDEAEQRQRYLDLGPLDLVKAKVAGHDELEVRVRGMEQSALIDEASKDPEDETRYRFKPSVLSRLLGGSILTKGERGAFKVVSRNGEEESSTPLQEWIDSEAAEFKASLEVGEDGGTRAVRQPGKRTPVKTTPSEEQLRKEKARQVAI